VVKDKIKVSLEQLQNLCNEISIPSIEYADAPDGSKIPVANFRKSRITLRLNDYEIINPYDYKFSIVDDPNPHKSTKKVTQSGVCADITFHPKTQEIQFNFINNYG
jgi:hypothetical protein